MLLSATELIGLLFGVFVASICVIRITRAFRKLQEFRSRVHNRGQSDDALEFRKPSDDYHDNTWLPLCNKAADITTARIGRPLTEEERLRIWKARSALTLEVLIKEAESTSEPGATLALLLTLPSGLARPDPTGWCDA